MEHVELFRNDAISIKIQVKKQYNRTISKRFCLDFLKMKVFIPGSFESYRLIHYDQHFRWYYGTSIWKLADAFVSCNYFCKLICRWDSNVLTWELCWRYSFYVWVKNSSINHLNLTGRQEIECLYMNMLSVFHLLQSTVHSKAKMNLSKVIFKLMPIWTINFVTLNFILIFTKTIPMKLKD